MKFRTVLKLFAVFAALATLAAACSSSEKSSGGGSSKSGSSAKGAGNAEFVKLGGWDDGACKPAQPKVVVGISEPMEVAGTSLKDYVDGTQAAVDAFNGRGGIGGRCLDLKVCDGKGDGPTELSCARSQTEDKSMVAGLASTFIVSEGEAYQLFEKAALPQIGAQVTLPGAWNSPLSFEFSMGGVGTLLADMPALKSIGVKKFNILLPANGQSGAFTAFSAPLVKSLGMQQLGLIQIPATAVEFTQFVQQAQKGAEGAALGLPGNVAGQIIDAMNSLNSNLKSAASWGTFSQKDVEQMPENIAKNMAFTDAIPPFVNTTPSKWPIQDVMVDDFKASGKSSLERDSLNVEPASGWLAVYTLIKVMRDAHATTITRATVKAAFDKAKDIPMFDLTPPWTPAKQSTNAVFKGISNPYYWTGHWDAGKKEFVVDPKQVDILKLLG